MFWAARGEPASLLAPGTGPVGRAIGCLGLALILVLVIGGAATIAASHSRISRTAASEDPAPAIDLAAVGDAEVGKPVTARGDLDFTRRRFFYRIEVDLLGVRRSALLLEYFPLRFADGGAIAVGRVLAESADPEARTAHLDPRHARTPEIVTALSIEGVVEETPGSIAEDFRRSYPAIRARGLVVEGAWGNARRESARRSLWMGWTALGASVVLALVFGRMFRRLLWPRSASS
jgi:hypothetical protein